MDFDEIREDLRNSLLWNLVMNSPVLSGSMQYHIQLGYGADGYDIKIEAPFYDIKKWNKDKTIIYTGESKNGKLHYAESVNEAGGFSTHNASEHWVNRVVNTICRELAKKYNGKVEGYLPR